jgi:hypothetical protein
VVAVKLSFFFPALFNSTEYGRISFGLVRTTGKREGDQDSVKIVGYIAPSLGAMLREAIFAATCNETYDV